MRDIKMNLDDVLWIVEYLADSAHFDSTYDKWTQGGRVSVCEIESDKESQLFVAEYAIGHGMRGDKSGRADTAHALGRLLNDMAEARLLDAVRTRISVDPLTYRYEFRLRFDVLQKIKESPNIEGTVTDIIPRGWIA